LLSCQAEFWKGRDLLYLVRFEHKPDRFLYSRTKSRLDKKFHDLEQFQQLIGWNRAAKIEPLILKATYFS
jgi:hypothetical protein